MNPRDESALRAIGIDPRRVPPGATINGKPVDDYRPQTKRPAGGPNKTEAAWSAHLDWLQSLGKVTAYWFHPGSLRLTDPDPQTGRARYYQPDFLVKMVDGELRMIEIKGGHVWEDAAVKFDQARQAYGEAFRFSMIRKVRSGWETIRGEDWTD